MYVFRNSRRGQACAWALFCLALCGLALLAPQVRAQPDAAAEITGPTLSLKAAIERALKANPALRVFDYRDAALRGDAITAGLRPPLHLAVEVENIAGSEAFKGTDSAETTVSLSSVIELGGQRQARLAIASSERARLLAEQQTVALDLLGEVTRRYVDLLAGQHWLDLAKDAHALAEEALAAVQSRSAAGAAPQAEVLRAQASLEQARLVVVSAERDLDYFRLSLAALWGERNPDFAKASGELYAFAQAQPYSELFARAEKNPAIGTFATEQRLREAELRLARSESRLDLNWSLGLRHVREQDASALVAGISVPLFSGHRNRAAITTAMAERDAVALRREAALLALHSQLYRAFSAREQAILTVESLRDHIIPRLRRALGQTREAWQRGLYSYQEWFAARQELIEARGAMIEAAARALRYGAEIEQLTAEALPAAAGDTHSASGTTP